MFFILFYPKTTSSLLLLFFDGPSATVELITQHVYPAFGCGVNNLVFYAQSIQYGCIRVVVVVVVMAQSHGLYLRLSTCLPQV